MSEHQYEIDVDEANDSYTIVDGNGVTLVSNPIPAYGVDYKRFLADAMVAEYQTNGISDNLVEMFYVAFAETYSVV